MSSSKPTRAKSLTFVDGRTLDALIWYVSNDEDSFPELDIDYKKSDAISAAFPTKEGLTVALKIEIGYRRNRGENRERARAMDCKPGIYRTPKGGAS